MVREGQFLLEVEATWLAPGSALGPLPPDQPHNCSRWIRLNGHIRVAGPGAVVADSLDQSPLLLMGGKQVRLDGSAGCGGAWSAVLLLGR